MPGAPLAFQALTWASEGSRVTEHPVKPPPFFLSSDKWPQHELFISCLEKWTLPSLPTSRASPSPLHKSANVIILSFVRSSRGFAGQVCVRILGAGADMRDATSCPSCLFFAVFLWFFFKVSLLNFLRSYWEHLNLKKRFNGKFQPILLPSGNYRGHFFHFNCANYVLILILELFHFPVFCACPFCVPLTLLWLVYRPENTLSEKPDRPHYWSRAHVTCGCFMCCCFFYFYSTAKPDPLSLSLSLFSLQDHPESCPDLHPRSHHPCHHNPGHPFQSARPLISIPPPHTHIHSHPHPDKYKHTHL